MRGSVLGYDAGAGVSVVRGEDGRRYAFAPAAWREARPPRKGDLVDFEPNGNRADLVFLLSSPRERERSAQEATTPLAISAKLPVMRMLFAHPVLPTGLFVLLAGFATAYRLGGDAVSLYAVPELISGFARAIEGAVGASGADPQPRLVAAVLRFVLPLMLLLYAVPLLTARAMWKEYAGQGSGDWGRWAGLSAMILPIVLPLLVIAPAHLVLLPIAGGTNVRLGGGGLEVPRHAFDVLRFYGTGTVLLFVTGLWLYASATGRFAPLRERRPAPGATTGSVLRDGPASFGPPSVRKEEAREESGEMVLPAALQRRQQSSRLVRDAYDPGCAGRRAPRGARRPRIPRGASSGPTHDDGWLVAAAGAIAGSRRSRAGRASPDGARGGGARARTAHGPG